jgi:hypothetical protein
MQHAHHSALGSPPLSSATHVAARLVYQQWLAASRVETETAAAYLRVPDDEDERRSHVCRDLD